MESDREAEVERIIGRIMEHMGPPRNPLAGGTGRLPRGKVRPDDKGELRVAIGSTDDGLVVLDFGPDPVSWIGMTADDAESWARNLMDTAASARRRASASKGGG